MYFSANKVCCYTRTITYKLLNSNNNINVNPFNVFNKKYYHSDQVFGYKTKPKTNYVVSKDALENRSKHANFYRLVLAYRRHGHKCADINPVALAKDISIHPELELQRYNLNDNDKIVYTGIINHGTSEGTIGDAVNFLNYVYTKHLSAEFMHLETEEEYEWFSNRFEHFPRDGLDDATRKRIATDLLKSQVFDHFLGNKFTGVKRYGGEGAESMMAFFSEFFKLSSDDDIQQVVLCMPHRGRLNLLTGMLKFPPGAIFTKLGGMPDFSNDFQSTGDVLSHCISSIDLEYDQKLLHVTMLHNPSHLEAVNPVSMGKTRAKQLIYKDGDYSERECKWGEKILNLQVHGDAAFSGQGINQECLALSGTPHFEIGGTIHLIVNNQLGFTTPAERGRSSRYCTDLAKSIGAPILHVSGDFPEMVIRATRIAFEYQRKFRKDVFIDLNCYRQWGHNELDDPTFTNPTLYRIIRSRKTVPDVYSEKLIGEGLMSDDEVSDIVRSHNKWLNDGVKTAIDYIPDTTCFQKQWYGFNQAQEVVTAWDTGVHKETLADIGVKSVSFPVDFDIHPHLLKTHVAKRLTKINEQTNIDWATAEALAIGSLLHEGYNVRISGQDVGRGTFSHRHAMLVDQTNNTIHIPLNSIHPKQRGFLELANSVLSEEAVLGYEYGMSIENPNNLIIWEAQFGDFFNGAQIIFDTFVTSGEAKWLRCSGLTILLPHGYDGAGPEHSSARIERFLQLTDSKEDKPDGDNVNMEVCQPSTPAQYFHLLRKQMTRNYRKPLIIIAPKTLLRLSECTSNFNDMEPGTFFMPVIGDQLHHDQVNKVILTSGKHYYSLLEKRQNLGIKDTALIRLESFCPFPVIQLRHELEKYPTAKAIVWSQEEPRNMGAWTFIKPRFENLIGRKITYCGRNTLATPAVGVGSWHRQEAADVITKPFFVKTK